MITHARAELIAKQYLTRLSEESGIDLSVDPEATVETPDGWLFFWNSTAYLASNSISDALGGNGPLRVRRDTGEVERLPVHYTTD